ncbi:ATP-binding protein [Vibrio sp. SS-MA-C1-2]|uniref:AAA family ATPase n=1 Tax=Vibrio sp. SS-MA-C1-2 TaxID=2908646 RepID=UPI001F3C629D|nr:AAA family ATPase [Vibrio sp. SS-MA-C1-2]UJF17496.1 ATP-binding protein [Vibrio sp. SS-MA-C1-2]
MTVKQKLTLIRGVPGSGKSTLGATLNGTLLEADMYFIDKKGNYRFNGNKIKQAHQWCQNETKNALLRGEDVIVANTFIKLWEMQFYLELPHQLNLPIEVEVIELEGRFQNIHQIPNRVIQKMKSQFQPYSYNATATIRHK